MKKNSKKFKMMAMTVIMALIINLLPDIFAPVKVKAAEGSGSGIASYNGEFTMTYGNGAQADIPYKEELRQIGEGYEFTLEIDAETSISAESEMSTSSKNGVFTAQMEGFYIVDIYGGKGGNGGDEFVLKKGKGGQGGKRGHVYGAIYLKSGDKLIYSVGGNGMPVLVDDESAGNGGSGHGNEGGRQIGSGGGYTAVYLFRENESLSAFTDKDGNLNIDAVIAEGRASKLVMLAAGGGGGGAGSDPIPFDSKNPTPPNGGDGGRIESSESKSNNVGTIYYGSNGSSSSRENAYVGEGGTTSPGKAKKTDGARFSSGAGKSWAEGGTGGDGNFRGGGGGSGYNGGSGGIMHAQLTAIDVGGGGGGASFVSRIINTYSDGSSVDLNGITNNHLDSYLFDQEAADNGNEGGIFHIQVLNEKNAYDFLKNIKVDFNNISDYFEISSISLSDNGNLDGNTVTGINLVDSNGNGQNCLIKVILTPKEGFAGGNDVNLFKTVTDGAGNTVLDSIALEYSKDAETRENSYLSVGDTCGYVNVPINGYNLIGKTADYYEGTTNSAIVGSSLVTKKIDATINDFVSAKTDIVFKITDSDSGYTVSDDTVILSADGKLALENDAVINKNKMYTAGISVEPTITEPLKAIIGPKQIKKDITTNVYINYVTKGGNMINGSDVTISRKLNENGGTYTYTIDGKIDNSNREPHSSDNTPNITQPDKNTGILISQIGGSNNTSNYTIEKKGWYYVDIKGANGGFGALGLGSLISNGGTGADISGYFYIDEGGTSISVTTNDVGTGHLANDPGDGGKGSYIKIGNDFLVAAGGGGGGECGYGSTQGYDGENSTAYGTDASNIDGKQGGTCSFKKHDSNSYKNGGTKGSAGKSFIADSFSNSQPFLEYNSNNVSVLTQKISTKISSLSSDDKAKGYCYIIPVEYTPETITTYEFESSDSTYTLNTTISEYFELNSVKVYQDGSATPLISKSKSDGTLSGNTINLSIPFTSSLVNGETTLTSASRLNDVDFKIEIDVTPIEGFLGGNDVPVTTVLETVENIERTVTFVQGSEQASLEKEDSVDYANVAINKNALDGYLSETGIFSVTENNVYIKGYDAVRFSQVTSGTDASTRFSGINSAFVTITDVNETNSSSTFNGDPSEDINIPFTFSIVPKFTATKANCIPEVGEYSLTKYGKISVMSSVGFNLTNLSINKTNFDPEDPLTIDNPHYDPNDSESGPEKISVKRIVVEPDGENFVCKFSPTGNYKLPIQDDVIVEYKVMSLSDAGYKDISGDCSFDEFTGDLIIKGKYLKENSVIVTASARTPDDKYKIIFEYQTAPEPYQTDPDENYLETYADLGPDEASDGVIGYSAGALISTKNPTNDSFDGSADDKITIADYLGYDFFWEDGLYYDENDANTSSYHTYGKEADIPVTMPSRDINISGYYVPKTYHLVINYVNGSGTPVATQYVEDYIFGQNFNVVSPTVTGMKPESPAMYNISGTIDKDMLNSTTGPYIISLDTDTITYNVTYIASTRTLTVMFLKEDGTNMFPSIDISFDSNIHYSYDLAASEGSYSLGKAYTLTGYKTFIDSAISYTGSGSTTFEGDMTDSGKVVKVVYVGESVSVKFDWSSGPSTTKPSTRTVQYGGYISNVWNETDYSTIQPLPSPTASGWTFKGWKTAADATSYVNNYSIIDSTSEIILYADWESANVSIYVYYYDKKYSKQLGYEKVEAVAGSPKTIYFDGYTNYTYDFVGGLAESESCVWDDTISKYVMTVTSMSDRYVYVYFTIESFELKWKKVVIDEDGNFDINQSDSDFKNVFSDGKVDAGTNYSIIAPNLVGYTYTVSSDPVGYSLTGITPAKDLYITITYAPIVASEIICVTVTWENMNFNYYEGIWNPDTHTYNNPYFEPINTDNTGAHVNPKITVKNIKEDGYVQPIIRAELSYSRYGGSFNSINGNFSEKVLDVDVGDSSTSTFWLTGTVGSGLTGQTRKVGTVCVTITRKGKSNK